MLRVQAPPRRVLRCYAASMRFRLSYWSVICALMVVGCADKDGGGSVGTGGTGPDDGGSGSAGSDGGDTGDAGGTGGGGTGDGGSGDGGTGDGGTGSGTLGCADLFDAGPFDCNDSLQENCDYLAGEPGLVVGWSITYEFDAGDESLPNDEKISDFERKAQCVTEYLEDLGVEHGSAFDDSFFVEATYAQVEPLCRASMIDDCEPEPLEETCAWLDEDECDAIPLCWPYKATRLEPGADCVTHDVFAACNTGACAGASVIFVGPDGACWYFGSLCSIAESGWVEDTGTCPDWDVLDTLQEC